MAFVVHPYPAKQISAMLAASTFHLVFASFIGGWEMLMIVAVALVLLGAKKLPNLINGMGAGISRFTNELDRQAHDVGASAGGIFGKPAAEALTCDNQTAEFYNPDLLQRPGSHKFRRNHLRILLRRLWRSIRKRFKRSF